MTERTATVPGSRAPGDAPAAGPDALLRVAPGLHRFPQAERIRHGLPVAAALAEELALTGARRVFVVTNRSLAASPQAQAVVAALGDRLAGRFDAVRAHSPRVDVMAGAAAAREAGADLLLALGGGSVIDAAKAMLLCLRHGYTATDQLSPHANVRPPDTGLRPADAERWLRLLAVPTTLSGAEFAPSAGVTDTGSGMKHALVHPMQQPQTVILDPAMTLATPVRLLLATGIKAVDHAVERLTAANATPFCDAVGGLALRLLARWLPVIADAPDDLDARAQLQYAVFLSMHGAAAGSGVHVSHAIGHVLGAHAGVPHGETACVIAPAVLRWTHASCAARQAAVARAFQDARADAAAAGEAADHPAGMAGASDTTGAAATADAAEAAAPYAALIARLGLPGRLRDVGVRREDFATLAAKTMHEAALRNSPRPVRGPADIEAILDSAW